ncbi:DUF5954 family protein [Streptomyces abikoensis]|uniref:DUF5954 family protein n=1 Tax=Streptomyces abikoensis TaxID=97398 RepID=A0ABW7TD78_9ACTN
MAELDGENVPAYRKIRIAVPEEPVASLADVEAWRARETYPDILLDGHPVFGVAKERMEGGWELVSSLSSLEPQEARDSMGSVFRLAARTAQEAGDPAGHDAYMSAAERMDREAVDEVAVRGVRYRVVRAERFLRGGPQGPEPPRPTDADPTEPGDSHRAPDPADGFVIDPFTATGMSEGILKMELLSLVRKEGTVPEAVRDDSVRATETHPGGVLLPAVFGTAEYTDGRWRPDSAGASTTPQGARDTLALKLRVMIPWQRDLTPEERAPYTAAADRLDAARCDELEVLSLRCRVVRMERLVRIGPDGPEGPRPSDLDSTPPVKVQDERLRAQGADTDDEDAPIELDAPTQRLADLFHEEEARRKARRPRER